MGRYLTGGPAAEFDHVVLEPPDVEGFGRNHPFS
jgi:hypothetical protein